MLAAHFVIAGLTAAIPAEQLPAPAFGQSSPLPAPQAPLPPETPAPPAELEVDQIEAAQLADPAPEQPVPAAETASTIPAPVEAVSATPAAPRELAALRSFSDPLEFVNRIFYAITQPIDRFILRPAAIVYKTVVPKPARDGLRNVLSNMFEPIVFVNDLLQIRPDRAIRTLGRFLVNTLIGVGGLFDLAKRKPFKIPHHPNNFGNTLGYYGVGPLVYLYLPILGPTTLRDAVAQQGDGQIHGRVLDKVLHSNSGRTGLGQVGTVITVLDGLDRRAENDAELKALTADSVDPYAALRSSFLQDRAGEIASLKAKGDGNAPPPIEFDDPLDDPAAGETATPAKASSEVPLPLAQ